MAVWLEVQNLSVYELEHLVYVMVIAVTGYM